MAEKKSLPKRSEVDVRYTWAIEDLYVSDEQWQKEYEKIKEMLPKAAEYQGRLSKSGDLLLSFLQLCDQINQMMERVYVYANQKYHEDTGNSTYQDLSNKAGSLFVQVNQYAFICYSELLKIPEDMLAQFYHDNEELSSTILSEGYLRRKAHILSGEMEELLADVGEIAEAPDNIFSMFNNADIKFPEIRNEEGEMVRITHGRYGQLLESEDRRVRREAFEGVYSTYYSFRNTLAASFSANVKQEAFFAKARKYSSTLEKALSDSNVPVEVYTNLIDAVHENMHLMHRYVAFEEAFRCRRASHVMIYMLLWCRM